MTLTELKARYKFYHEETAGQIEKAKYYNGFGYKPGHLEDVQAENETVLRLIEEKEIAKLVQGQYGAEEFSKKIRG